MFVKNHSLQKQMEKSTRRNEKKKDYYNETKPTKQKSGIPPERRNQTAGIGPAHDGPASSFASAVVMPRPPVPPVSSATPSRSEASERPIDWGTGHMPTESKSKPGSPVAIAFCPCTLPQKPANSDCKKQQLGYLGT